MLIDVGGVRLGLRDSGTGPPVLMVHGWPHTGLLWRDVAARLPGYRVLAPDGRGTGESDRPATGYDAATLAGDLTGLLDALGLERATLVAIDAGVSPAFLAALLAPDRFDRLVLMEGAVPGLADPPPLWWFGFHAVPGLAETVLAGHEAEYVHYFLTGPSIVRPLPTDVRAAFAAAYTGRAALRAGFEHYRHLAQSADQVCRALDGGARLTVPTLAVAGGVVGDALRASLAPVADHLTGAVVEDCGHLIPLERPDVLAELITG